MASFIPRHAFPPPASLPKSYFLGHHRAGLTKMNSMLSQIDLIIECRDYRVPLSSTNPMFEQLLQGRNRIVVFTKRDLGAASPPNPEDQQVRPFPSTSLHPNTNTPPARVPPQQVPLPLQSPLYNPDLPLHHHLPSLAHPHPRHNPQLPDRLAPPRRRHA